MRKSDGCAVPLARPAPSVRGAREATAFQKHDRGDLDSLLRTALRSLPGPPPCEILVRPDQRHEVSPVGPALPLAVEEPDERPTLLRDQLDQRAVTGCLVHGLIALVRLLSSRLIWH